MVKQWVQPPINKNKLPMIATWSLFFGGPISQVLLFISIIKVFIGIVGENCEIHFLAICFF